LFKKKKKKNFFTIFFLIIFFFKKKNLDKVIQVNTEFIEVQQKAYHQEKICMKIKLDEIYNQNMKVIDENNEFKAKVQSYEAENKEVKFFF
jgi:hypothetical protein